MLRTQTNKHAMKELVVEKKLDREAEVEVILEDKTMDAKDSNSPRNAMATKIALFI